MLRNKKEYLIKKAFFYGKAFLFDKNIKKTKDNTITRSTLKN